MTETPTLSATQAKFVEACERNGWVVERVECNRWTGAPTVYARNGAGTVWALLGAYQGERSVRHSAMIRPYTGDYEGATLRKLFSTVGA